MQVSTERCQSFSWAPMAAPEDWQTTDLWVNREDDIYASGFKAKSINDLVRCVFQFSCGFVGHYDGQNWREVELPYEVAPLGGFWGTDSNNLHVVGLLGHTLHYDGTNWDIRIGDADTHLARVWGTDARNLFAVGAQHFGPLNPNAALGPLVASFDGETWQPAAISLLDEHRGSRFFTGVAGTSATNVFASGDKGAFFHYDGKSWEPVDLNGNIRHLYALAAAPNGDVLAVGQHGTTHLYRDHTWHELDTGIQSSLLEVIYAGSNHWFASSEHGDILRLDGDTWSPETSGVDGALGTFAMLNQDRLIAAGTHGTILQRHGSDWRKVSLTESSTPIHQLHADSEGCLYAANKYTIYVSDITRRQWRVIDGAAEQNNYETIWGKNCGDEIYTSYTSEHPVGGLARYKNGIWSLHQTEDERHVSDIWANNNNTIFFTTNGGTIAKADISKDPIHIHPLANTNVAGQASSTIWGLSEDRLYIGGKDGLFLKFDGHEWTRETVAEETLIRDLWGSSEESIFITTIHGIYKHNGTSWHLANSPHLSRGFLAIWGVSPNAVFAGGYNGFLAFYDGEHWSRVRSPTKANITAVWASGWPGELFIGTEFGEIYSTTQFAQ
ncbi:MAG: hypothetical protein Tsb0020_22260 [Haliangiales bacterium]